ncbi:MAG: S8 family serine peptidase, partial [Peptostreptococcaceae bacterium]
PQYKGVATASKLVVVKLREYYGTYAKGKVNYSNTDFLAAIKYILDVADKAKLPLIVNMTIGTMSSSTSEIHILDTFDRLNRVGTVVVSGAGNEGNTDTHFSGIFTSVGQIEDVIIQVAEQTNIDIVLNGSGPDKIASQIISPSGEVGYKVKYHADNYIYRGKFNLENTSYQMRLIYPWIASGKQRLEIKLNDVKPGVWTLRLTPEFIVNGQYDIYLPNKNIISEKTRFLDPDSIATVTMYGAERDYITIGTFNDKTDSMWLGSSKGPIRGIGIKPDMVAPGVDIIGTSNDGKYNTGTGTGISSSIISGVLAIIMEYLIEQTQDAKLILFSEVLKTYLMLGATKKDIYTYPNISQGYGILNLKRTIEEIANNL